MASLSVTGLAALLVISLGCAPQAPLDDDSLSVNAQRAVVDRDWVLIQLGERNAPTGAGGRAPTLRFDSMEGRAAGFAGCNRFGATYVLRGDSLTFGPVMSTKMACSEGMELEQSYAAMLTSVVSYVADGSTLTLRSATGVVARYRAQ